MIYYYIPGFIRHYNVNMKLLELIQSYPEMFYDDFKIGAVFGNFPNCTWNGGGYYFGEHYDIDDMIRISSEYNAYGVPLRLTMTNPLIEERDLYDRYGNYIMKNLNNGINQVLISSPILEAYIRDKYPEYPIVRSILATENIYYDDSDKYFMSVLRKHKNNDLEFLKSIKNKEKIEMLITETCQENCPRTYEHYAAYAKKQLHQDNEALLNIDCSYSRNYVFKKLENSPLALSREIIKSIYEPMGFHNFKISGRTTHGRVVIHYANYMVKPEYKDDFIDMMMDAVCADNRTIEKI